LLQDPTLLKTLAADEKSRKSDEGDQ